MVALLVVVYPSLEVPTWGGVFLFKKYLAMFENKFLSSKLRGGVGMKVINAAKHFMCRTDS